MKSKETHVYTFLANIYQNQVKGSGKIGINMKETDKNQNLEEVSLLGPSYKNTRRRVRLVLASGASNS